MQIDKLTNKHKEKYLDFISDFSEEGCYCSLESQCHYCTHEGNPKNLRENEEAWLTTDELKFDSEEDHRCC